MSGRESGGESGPIRLLTAFRAIDRASASAVEQALREVLASVHEEPGSQDYEVCVDLVDERTIWVVELWSSQADARRHEAAAVRSGGVERLAALLRAPLETTRLAVLASAATGASRSPANGVRAGWCFARSQVRSGG